MFHAEEASATSVGARIASARAVPASPEEVLQKNNFDVIIHVKEIQMNRFDMEQMIMSCWGTKEDIDLISERIMEDDLSKDSIANALIGLAEIHDMKCKKLFDIFEEMVDRGEIKHPEEHELLDA